MTQMLTRLAGIALVVAGLAGLIFTVAGLVVVAQVAPQAQAAITRELDVIDTALTTTAEGLEVADTSLGRADTTVGALQTTIASTGAALTSSLPTLGTLSTLTGEDLPATIESTQQALGSARETARVADQILGAISALRLLSTETYNPDVPLNEAIGQVSSSLDGLPASLRTVRGGLDVTTSNLRTIQGDMESMSDDVGEIAASLREARSVIVRYQGIVGDLQAEVARAREVLPRWVAMGAWGVTLLLIWLGMAQIGLLTQGWELIQRSRDL